MNRQEFEALDARVEARATRLWSDAGSPDGGHARFLDQARELTALEEVELPGLDPEEAAEPVVEEAFIQGNLGEFPTLRDQGDEQTYPNPQSDSDLDGEIRLSDGDASDAGGVLPDDDLPEEDLPEISLADADVTSSALDADDDPLNDDLNDDGMPDAEDLDADDDDEDGLEEDDEDDLDDDDLDEDDLDDDDVDEDDLDDDDLDDDEEAGTDSLPGSRGE